MSELQPSEAAQTVPRVFLLDDAARADFERRVEAALAVHDAWMTTLREAVLRGSAALDPEAVARDETCPIAQWLTHEIPPELRSTLLYTRSKLRHAEFHEAAARVLVLAMRRDPAARAAIAPGGFLANVAGNLRSVLSEWREHARA